MNRTHLYLAFEFSLIFLGIPTGLVLGAIPLHPIPVLWLVAILCFILLRRDESFDRRLIWRMNQWKPSLVKVLIRFAVAALCLTLYVAWFEPELLFYLPRSRPFLWVVIMVLYPLLSVYPQGITHRLFIFHRYRRWTRSRWALILMSTTAFSFMHIVFRAPEALVLTFLGGFLFAKTYEETESLILSGIEHALYGNLAFTLGLGRYLYTGNIVGH
jgi:hypothetical protein